MGVPDVRTLRYVIFEGSTPAAVTQALADFLAHWNKPATFVRLPYTAYLDFCNHLGVKGDAKVEFRGIVVKPWPLTELPDFWHVAMRFEDE